MANKDINLKITNDLNITLNTLKYKDLINLKNNLSNDSLVISSYDPLYNDGEIELVSYQDNYLSFIDHNCNIIPLTYNLKDKFGVLNLNDNHLIKVDIDNFTVNDSSILPRKKTIELTYIYGWNKNEIPVNIIDSYSYMIDSYSYQTVHNDFSYECEYNYYLYTYYTYEELTDLGYLHESYTYYPVSYNFQNNDLNISYSIKYSYNNYTYSYNYSYTYLINQFENDFIYVNKENLDKADYNIGIFKSDLDTLQIKDGLLNINPKYTDILYCNDVDYYKNIYKNLNIKYNNLLLKSSIINSYIFNYKPYEELILSFNKYSDLYYFDKDKKEKITNNCKIKIGTNITEFNLCIPIEFTYKSYIEDIDPIDINKILINIIQKKNDETINGYSLRNLFNYDELLNDNFQQSTDGVLNTLYQKNYKDTLHGNLYNFISHDEVEINIEKSYLLEKRITKYDSINSRYYGVGKYVFNFILNKKNIKENTANGDIFQFDIVMFIKDVVLGDINYNECNKVNENYKLLFSFYLDQVENNYKQTQTYDIVYHDYNHGYNFDKHGEMLGICFVSQDSYHVMNLNLPKPIFVKYNHYNDFVKVNLDKLFNATDNINTCLSLRVINNLNNPLTFKNTKIGSEILISSPNIKETYYNDKIYNIDFNYIKKSIDLYPFNGSSGNPLVFNFMINNHKIQTSNNNYEDSANRIYNNKLIFNPDILKKYFNSVYNLRASGLRNGDYYIPSINEYYIMDLYNILSIYGINNFNLVSSMIYDNKPILAHVNLSSCKIDKLIYYTEDYKDQDIDYIEAYNNIDNKYVLPIFKLPDYSIINNGNYDIIFDEQLNYETVILLQEGLGYFSLKVKKYYDFNNNLNIWYGYSPSKNIKYVDGLGNSINPIEIIPELDDLGNLKLDDNNCFNLNVMYKYSKNIDSDEKILYFDIGFIDSDASLNTDKISGKNCRILCKVVTKIRS